MITSRFCNEQTSSQALHPEQVEKGQKILEKSKPESLIPDDICIFGHIGFGSLHARPLFDPEDILNPNTLFNTTPITEHMELVCMSSKLFGGCSLQKNCACLWTARDAALAMADV